MMAALPALLLGAFLLLFLHVEMVHSQTAFMNVSFRLSTYQTSAANVTLTMYFKNNLPIPPYGQLVVTTFGTTSQPPLGGTKTPASINCAAVVPAPYSPITNCASLYFREPLPYNAIGPYIIMLPMGLLPGPTYRLTLEGMYNQDEEGTALECMAYTTNAVNSRIEADYLSTRFSYSRFWGQYRLSSYTAGISPVTLTVFFFTGQTVDLGDAYVYVQLSGVSGTGTLNCSGLWNSSAHPLPGCSPDRLVGNGNPYRISVDTMYTQTMYSFSISGLSNAPVAGYTASHPLRLTYGTEPFNKYMVPPFFLLDDQAPVFTSCPSNIVTSTDPRSNSTTVSWPLPTFTDNLGATMTGNYQPGDRFNFGTTKVTYVARDGAGNTAICTFNVTVLDTEAPQFTCPANITVNTTLNSPSATVTWPIPTAVDNISPNPTVTVTQQSGTSFRAGTTRVTYTVQDTSLNIFTCSFFVIVMDIQPPTIRCPNNITQPTDYGQPNAMITWPSTLPSAVDNVGVTSLITTPPTGSGFLPGTTAVTSTAYDAAGNMVSCTFYVTVQDTESPTVPCPANVTVNSFPSQNISTATWTPPLPRDNVGVVLLVSSYSPGAVFPVGSTRVQYSATDAAGNMGNCTFWVNVMDREPPRLICPAPITQVNDPGMPYATVQFSNPSATDNVRVTDGPRCNVTSGQRLTIGVNIIQCIAGDGAGNVATCTFTVVVLDNEAPTLSCSGNITQSTGPGLGTTVVRWPAPVATDNFGTPVITPTWVNGVTLPVGLTVVQYIATDASNNTANCTFVVTVVDTEKPKLTCPPPIVKQMDPGISGAIVTWSPATATDNDGLVGLPQSNMMPGSMFPPGVTMVTYNVSDRSGNVAVCSFKVHILDEEAPTIICPPDRVQATTVGLRNGTVSWSDPLATDNVGVTAVIAVPPSGSVFQLGNTTVHLTAMDAAGNTANCSFLVTILDQERPVIICPPSMTLGTDPGKDYRTVFWTPPSLTYHTSDNVGVRSVTSTREPGIFPLGTTVVTYTATDLYDNWQRCSFAIIITDRESPVLSCPSNIIQAADSGKTTTTVSWAAPMATDNVGVTFDSISRQSGTQFPIGTTPVTFIARDEEGNSNSCTWNVTVQDLEPPRLKCPADVLLMYPFGPKSTTVQWPPVIATDNDKVATINSTNRPGDLFKGRTTVTYTAIDQSGNSASCSFLVVVSTFVPNITSTTPRTAAPVHINITFIPEVTVPAGGTLHVLLPTLTGAPTLTCPTRASPLPGCDNLTQGDTIPEIIDGAPYTILLSPTADLVVGEVYGFGLDGLFNPPVPGQTPTLGMQTYDPTGALLDENLYLPPFDIMSVVFSTTELEVPEDNQTSFTVVLDSRPSSPLYSIAIQFNSTNRNEAYATPTRVVFNSTTWNISQKITVIGVPDHINDGDQTIALVPTLLTQDPRWQTLGNSVDTLSVIVLDVDKAGFRAVPLNPVTTEAGGRAVVAVSLTSKPLADVFVNIGSSNPAEITVSPDTLLFTPRNWQKPKNLTLLGHDDLIDDGDQQIDITLQAISNDMIYAALPTFIIHATNLNDDVAGIEVRPSSGITYENADLLHSVTFQVRLRTQPVMPVTVSLESGNTAEGEVVPSALIFDPINWNQFQSFDVQSVDDSVQDGDTTYQVLIIGTDGDPKYIGVQTSVTVTNRDNDFAGLGWYPDIVNHTFVTREVLNAQFTDPTVDFWLNTQPQDDVIVVFTSSDPAQGIVSPDRVFVPRETWSQVNVITIIGQEDFTYDTDTPFSILVTIETQDPYYSVLNYTLQAVNLGRRYTDTGIATGLIGVSVRGTPYDFDVHWFLESIGQLFNVTTFQVEVDSHRACTNMDLAGVDVEQWYWIKFKPQDLIGATCVWFRFVHLPPYTNIPQFEWYVVNALNTNTTIRSVLGSITVASLVRGLSPRPSPLPDGCPQDIERYFEVTVEVLDVDPYSPIGPVVWATHSSKATNPIWVTGRYANEPQLHPLDGLRIMAETGNITELLQELEGHLEMGHLEAYGTGSADPMQVPEIRKGQTVKFGVKARPGDSLSLAAKLYRTNDRFVGTDEAGYPLFDAQCNPQWGTVAEVFFYDAGTALDQPFWANLYLGKDSRQLQGGSYSLGQEREHELVRQVGEAELSDPNDLHPVPSRLVRVTIERGLDVMLHPLNHSYVGGNATIQVSLPPDVSLGNEMRIEFPKGWFKFNAQDIPTKAIILSGMDGLPALPTTLIQGSTVILRFDMEIALTGRVAVLLVDNLKFPPVCGETEYRITTHHCYMQDIHGHGKYFYRTCSPPLSTVIGVPPNGMPRNCDLCHSCVFNWHYRYNDHFTCYTPEGASFLRWDPLDDTCADNPYSLPDYPFV